MARFEAIFRNKQDYLFKLKPLVRTRSSLKAVYALLLASFFVACSVNDGAQGPRGLTGGPGAGESFPRLRLIDSKGNILMSQVPGTGTTWQLNNGDFVLLSSNDSVFKAGLQALVTDAAAPYTLACDYESADCSGPCILSNQPLSPSIYVSYDSAGNVLKIQRYAGEPQIENTLVNSYSYSSLGTGGTVSNQCSSYPGSVTRPVAYILTDVSATYSGLPNLSNAAIILK